MKKEYITPELDVLRIYLSQDILGDSKPEPIDKPIIDEPIEDDLFV